MQQIWRYGQWADDQTLLSFKFCILAFFQINSSHQQLQGQGQGVGKEQSNIDKHVILKLRRKAIDTIGPASCRHWQPSAAIPCLPEMGNQSNG
eukprot:1317244-Amphidinium_carterae.1